MKATIEVITPQKAKEILSNGTCWVTTMPGDTAYGEKVVRLSDEDTDTICRILAPFFKEEIERDVGIDNAKLVYPELYKDNSRNQGK